MCISVRLIGCLSFGAKSNGERRAAELNDCGKIGHATGGKKRDQAGNYSIAHESGEIRRRLHNRGSLKADRISMCNRDSFRVITGAGDAAC
jgi:hypothetical protein